ncbi:hypothetical protein JCM15548_11817 [Geofilum rubicundum JCM 15548]|uniref:Uncharacterized protein n=1 Tax=Geofilum rubicundum JCM 15548 TaxID=1236989 RepID=A0A0E9LXL6_9BACT|nr:hypothetical protein JCM15548_11817 [Geofilum rubicundum JCM 15548]
MPDKTERSIPFIFEKLMVYGVRLPLPTEGKPNSNPEGAVWRNLIFLSRFERRCFA